MKLIANGEYLTPDFEVIKMTLTDAICTSGEIGESGENAEIGW